ncbi:carbon-nitrogen hydrolase family protein [Rhodalgimonas zhirmunskyi]|uniref:Carbon-nitrogen hydrolase family protein n=1 Tax=Rhodalgimonas zhirmunskyi TaxID=2964767 RepID=A0AAJ1UGT4_9RHOB|nr:carbon-nitrogen hydrolase family protein [Rhodoalgimonas zhirmunskyi]MDQ2095907.1 carbon-nitrogen hydrolase family protein [Rhodoalgimonas zhirmunskyi]
MKLALCQTSPTDGDIEAALARLDTMLAAAALAGARMAVFPELYLPGYNRPDLHQTLAQPQGGDWMLKAASLAARHHIGLTLGWAERDGDTCYNAATAFGPDGATLAHYRKIQLYGPMEQKSFAFGNSYATFNFEGRTCALLICYDVEFAHHVRALAERGVELLLVPTANPAGFEHVSRHIIPARASEYAMTVAYANYCGSEQGLAFGGHSLISAPDGAALASAHTTETMLITDTAHPVDPSRLSTQLIDYRETPQ